MALIKRKKTEKQSRIAATPVQEVKKPKLTKRKVFFLVLNVLSVLLYSCYSLFVIYRLSEKSFLSNVILVLFGVYALSLLLLLLFSIGNGRKLKNRMKSYKSAIKFLKYAVQIINFVLSIITAISALITTGTTDFSAVGYAVLSFIITIILVFVEIVSIIIRKNIPLIKHNFLEMRDPEKYNTGTVKKDDD